jgi:uncharacterized repeat protein (TIGR01451 family)
MKRSHIRQRTKILSGLFVAVAVAAVSTLSVRAWGPPRQTFTMQNPANHVTFNSITDDTAWGDERNFMMVKDVTTNPDTPAQACPTANAATLSQIITQQANGDGFSDVATAKDGHCYVMEMFVHNNAAINLNLIAKNVLAQLSVPNSANTSAQIQGLLSASNCGATSNTQAGTACRFWDEAYLDGRAANFNFRTSYISGSAFYFNDVASYQNGAVNQGFQAHQLADGDLLNTTNGFFGPGAKLGGKAGDWSMSGEIQGCFDYSGYLTFMVQTNSATPTFTLEKDVRVKGDTTWHDTTTAKPGDELEYRIKFQNTGAETIDQVLIYDLLPSILTYVPNSSTLINSNYPEPGFKPSGDGDWINDTDGPADEDSFGLNIGDYASQAGAFVYFDATVPANDALPICGENLIQNIAAAVTDNESKADTADVTVTKDCPPPTNPCPSNPNVSVDSPDCNPCEYDKTIQADDAKCVAPPNTGSMRLTAAIGSAILLVGLSTILVTVILRHNKQAVGAKKSKK